MRSEFSASPRQAINKSSGKINFQASTAMTKSAPAAWQRILLKLSGDALADDRKFGIEGELLAATANELKSIVELGVELGIVIGGGNFFRGMRAATTGIDRLGSDYIGMLR